MQSAQYTDDAICQSMGLESFEPNGVPCLRVLLKPSFHPEVCVTLFETAEPERARLQVVALREMLWRQEFPQRLTEIREERNVPVNVFVEAKNGFDAAVAEQVNSESTLSLDGLSVSCCHHTAHGIEQFSASVHRPTVSAFVKSLLWWAWVVCEVPGVRNALADCAWYLGADYPQTFEPERPRARKVIVMGTTESRADFLDALKSRGSGVAKRLAETEIRT